MRQSLPIICSGLLLIAAIGCQNRDEQLREEVKQELGEIDTARTDVVDEPIEPEVQSGATAAVVVDENTIGIDQDLVPGPVVLTIRNSGLNDHSLAVSGPGGEWQLETALAPGETGNLEVNLQEGSYRVYDPRNESLSTTVIVGAAAEGGAQ